MRSLKLIGLAIRHQFEEVRQWLRSIRATYRYWAQRPARNALEAERLDRIRNPAKYLGK